MLCLIFLHEFEPPVFFFAASRRLSLEDDFGVPSEFQ